MLLIFCQRCDEVLRVQADDSTEEVQRFVVRSGWNETINGHACGRCSAVHKHDELQERWVRKRLRMTACANSADART